jgi:hypothetical protein
VLLGLFTLFTLAQNGSETTFQCGTPGTSPNYSLLESVRIPDYSSYTFYVKVYVHVLSRSNTGPAQSVMGINQAMKRLYTDFDLLNIHLVWNGEVDYILNDDWYDLPASNFSSIVAHNYHEDGIDIYLGDSNSYSDLYAAAPAVGGNTAFFVSGREQIGPNEFIFRPQGATITHEMGHVLFLRHTFHGTALQEENYLAC